MRVVAGRACFPLTALRASRGEMTGEGHPIKGRATVPFQLKAAQDFGVSCKVPDTNLEFAFCKYLSKGTRRVLSM